MFRPKFTNAGKELQLRASIGGADLLFTKIQLGAGVLGDTDYKTLTALIDPKATLAITGIKVEEEYATIKGVFSNAEMEEGFRYRELGLFARDPDDPDAEILYCYANFGEDGGYIADPGSELIEKVVRIVAIVDYAENVSAVISESATYVDEQELEQAISEHNLSSDAHPNLVTFKVEYYVDSSTEEEVELRDGSEDHPFKTLTEARDAIPITALQSRIILKTGAITYDGVDSDGFENLKNLEIVYTGSAATKPTVAGSLVCTGCASVTFENFRVTAGADHQNIHLKFTDCTNVKVSYVDGSSLNESAIFLYGINSKILVDNFNISGVETAILADVSCEIYVYIGMIYGVTNGLYVDQGVIYNYATSISALHRIYKPHGGLILDTTTMGNLTNGTYDSHLINHTNPHNVSLGQAMAKGGTIDVAHGGTGKTSIQSGGIVKGNGTSALDTILGVGALFASASGSPEFGTLPINLGGTGRTADGIWANPNPTAANESRGCYIVPSSGNAAMMIQWGKGSMAGQTQEVSFHTAFRNDAYALLFTHWDFTLTDLSKSADKFAITRATSIGTQVFDWVAIGFVTVE